MKQAKIKKKICKEDNLILLHSNCDNCGSPLKLNMVTKECKCEYCKTEYLIKKENGNYYNLGQLIHITIGGVEKQFYISEIAQRSIGLESFRYIDDACSYIEPRCLLSIQLEEI